MFRFRRSGARLLPLGITGLALVLTACGGSASGSVQDASDGALPSASTEPRDVSLTVDGRQRSYLLQPALGLPAGARAALVVVLHQEGGTPAGIADEAALQALRRQGATLAYPAGVDRSWDAGACCGTSQAMGVDDMAFLDEVLVDAARQAPVDAQRQALVGYSSGAMLTYRYVCQRPARLAAAVVVSGSLESDCGQPITAPDMLALHGKADGTIGLTEPRFISTLGLAPKPAITSLGILTRSAGCPGPPATTRAPELETQVWAGCRGATVQALLVPRAGHGWATLDASRHTVDFLAEQLDVRG